MKKTLIITVVSVVATLGLSYGIAFATENQAKNSEVDSQVLQSDLIALQESINDLQNKVETSNVSNLETVVPIIQLETTITENDLETKINTATAKIEKLTTENDARKDKLNELNTQKELLSMELNNLKNNLPVLQNSVRELSNQRLTLYNEYNMIVKQKLIITLDPVELETLTQRKIELETQIKDIEFKRDEAFNTMTSSINVKIPELEKQIANIEQQMLEI